MFLLNGYDFCSRFTAPWYRSYTGGSKNWAWQLWVMKRTGTCWAWLARTMSRDCLVEWVNIPRWPFNCFTARSIARMVSASRLPNRTNAWLFFLKFEFSWAMKLLLRSCSNSKEPAARGCVPCVQTSLITRAICCSTRLQVHFFLALHLMLRSWDWRRTKVWAVFFAF